MGYPSKIATCCHCGSKAALTLDKGRHELTCASCGAPLRDLKMLPRKPAQAAAPRKTAVSHQPAVQTFPEATQAKSYKRKKPRKVKKYKSWLKDLAEDLFDVVEDIFD